MSHIEQGNYRTKHGQNAPVDQRVCEAIKGRAEDGRLSCAGASALAQELDVTMEEVGRNADLLEIKIDRCQLGLFGYGRTKGKHSIVEPPEQVSDELETAIRGALSDGKLTCVDSWTIAEGHRISKRAVCEAADKLGIKTSQCQLGVF